MLKLSYKQLRFPWTRSCASIQEFTHPTNKTYTEHRTDDAYQQTLPLWRKHYDLTCRHIQRKIIHRRRLALKK